MPRARPALWLGAAWLLLLHGCAEDAGKMREEADARVSVEGGADAAGSDGEDGPEPDDSGTGAGSDSGSSSDASGLDAAVLADADAGRPAEAGTDASGQGSDASMLGPSLFGTAPYSAPAKPIRRLALVDSNRLCVVLTDRTLFCTGTNGQLATVIAAQNHDVHSVTYPGVSDVRDYTLLRKDGSSHAFSPTNGSASNYRLEGAGYLAAQSWLSANCGLNADGTTRCSGEPWPLTLPEGPFVGFGGSPAQSQLNGLRVDGVVILASTRGTAQIPDLRFTSFDAARVFEGCGEAMDGSLHCYELDGRVTKHWPQTQRDLRDYAYGKGHVCVVQSDGRAACQKFDGSASPAAVPQDKRFVDIETVSTTATCGVTVEGELWCWSDRAADTQRVVLPMSAAVE